MNKAFIFDMDGVIVNSEQVWTNYESNFMIKLVGSDLCAKIGDIKGMTVNTTYDKLRKLGLRLSREEFQSAFDKVAFTVYDKTSIASGIEDLAKYLIKNNIKLGLVSASSTSWIRRVLPRLSFGGKFDSLISINERPDLRSKPNPDGYIEMMKNLDSAPGSTIILEDSNAGIAAAKASGAFTIAFTQNLVQDYKQIEADVKANNMGEVVEIVKSYYK